MLFKKNEGFQLLVCSSCGALGYKGARVCRECKGRSLGRFTPGFFLYYGEALTRYHIVLRKLRVKLYIFQIIGALIFLFGGIALFFWQVYANALFADVLSYEFWFAYRFPARALFWISAASALYLFYQKQSSRLRQEDTGEITYGEEPRALLQHQPLDWKDVNLLDKDHLRDISQFFTRSAKDTLEQAYALADEQGAEELGSAHLFYALLSDAQVSHIFARLGLPAKLIQAKVAAALSKKKRKDPPRLSNDLAQILFHAYEFALETKDRYVRGSALLAATVGQSEPVQEFLYDLKVDQRKLYNVIAWVRIRERLSEEHRLFREAAAHWSKYGMDRAMTAVATPFLNSISQDITLAAKYGNLSPCVARDKEIQEIFRIIEGGRNSVLLVGDQGVGKMSIVEGIAQLMLRGEIPVRLKEKRLVQISTSALLAGTTVSGAQQRVLQLMNEVAKAKNVVLFVRNIHDLMGSSDSGGSQGLDVSETLAEYLGPGRFLTLATASPEAYKRSMARSAISKVFSKVDVAEMTTDQAIQVLESKAGFVEYQQHVYFSYDALEQCVDLSNKFFHDQNLPESALSLMSEVASFVRSERGEGQLVNPEDVGTVVGQKTGIPASSITEAESEKLLRLEQEMHERIVGQDEAVISVANALRRARAQIRSQKRPIANFLFLGPTGVGKTELAKTIADVYFGGENRMIRVDMSEYQDKTGVYRLIGQPGEQGSGILTEAVRGNPFSLLLFDELEKADPNILNLFLQVFDDGRLTDSVGRAADFTNTIIIATSNAGTAYVQKRIKEGAPLKEIKEELMRDKLQEYYRPEFLNRFDGIVLFKPLGRDEIKIIASFMLKRVAKDLEQRGVGLRVEDSALEALAAVGYDPEFGARPMRRAIQDMVEDKLASLILENKLKRRDTVVLGEGAEIRVESGR
ncbi:MAG: ATP-dependent Clp protease ATP-binding subunit [Candidatus Magasanikbacteria bacterium]|nr:ATP-dependent Clp protease ATP-binding subunit [Candidatus Magasanikbacteria bacterium]